MKYSWLVLLAACTGWPDPKVDTGDDEEIDTGKTDSTTGTPIDTELPNPDDTGHSTDDSGTNDSDTDDSGTVTAGTATLSGTVTVQAYYFDETGSRVDINIADYTDTFPFGRIFVAAYDSSTGSTIYYGNTTIASPTIAPNPYTMFVNTAVPAVSVYAALDYAADAILSPLDPTGIHASAIPIVDGDAIVSVDIVIDVEWDPNGGGGGGGGGGTSVPTLNLSGDLNITTPYVAGESVAMIYDMSNIGPYYAAWSSPVSSGNGASSSYAMDVPQNLGNIQLIGAWDSNVNSLIDPTDNWGYLSNGGGTNSNPLFLGSVDVSGADIYIPLGGSLSTVPFVSISGDLTTDSGDFTSYGAVYVAALKYRPVGDFNIADLSTSYDYDAYSNSDLSNTTLGYSLVVPANAQTYIFAFADDDGDGLVQESGEHVGFLNGGNALGTGIASQTGQNINLLPGP